MGIGKITLSGKTVRKKNGLIVDNHLQFQSFLYGDGRSLVQLNNYYRLSPHHKPMGQGAARLFLTAMVLVIAFPILGNSIRGSDGPFSRPLSSPIIIDDDADLVLTAVASSWPGDGSLDRPFIIDDLTIDALGKGACIYLGNTSLHVMVRNCSLTGASPVSSNNPGAGLVIWDCTNVTVDNCTANGNLFGIYSMASSRCTLSNSTLSNDRNDIILIHSNDFVVEHNDLTGSTEGLMLQSSNRNTIRHNTLSRSSLLSMGMYESKENILTDNLFHNNTGESYIYLSDSNQVLRNSFKDNAMALKLSWSPYNTMNDNLF